ncbi:Ribonuclease/ribotoxin [Dendrothele bispora CBS 962.96]|uniref:Ribonuclease/ribotoxin n=1 Tax=Dendrothele bispora (strain CBS 962.96) TaxID=1314807 RepID=A0A4S8LJU2_DENBC|nr:Ribonuclease/ribotoxin [Dendrothele bispora CBS 962.96]
MLQIAIVGIVSWSLLSLVAAIPLNATIVPRAWPAGDVTCGSNVYSLNIVKAATSNGFAHINNPIGSNSYPHTFSNFEGLKMWCTGETQFNEWPILVSGPYTGGSPGADRVVFSDNGIYCAVITHTGASGNNFVSCKGD